MFFRLKQPTAEGYSPLFFLSALGSGGLSISFFMYLMFWMPHQGSPIPAFSHMADVFQGSSLWLQITAVIAMVGIIGFAINYFRMLLWNLSSYQAFRQTDAFQSLKNSNAETQLMAIPLTLSMGVNVLFILAAVFVPGLWGIKEWLFPFALLAFGAIGVQAFRIYLDFFSRAMTEGGFDCSKNNNLSQILPAFAFAMIGVGFAASAAMSDLPVTVIIGMIGAIFFTVTALVLALIKLVLGFRAMFEHGAAVEGLPTLLVMIPVLTIVGITLMRLSHGAHVLVDVHTGSPFFWLTAFIAMQGMFAILGLSVKKRTNYFGRFVHGSNRSPSSFALICPGVAGFVLLNFWINKGLVPVLPAEVLSKFDLAYFVLYLPLIYLQYKTIRLYSLLNRKVLGVHPDNGSFDARTAS
ncbi:TsoY family (seleno)protein [Reinekea blandensis]|uniref:Uncharacterized protein n=1 Tax=Reinekea blandensis MED297 TaxID=314283 RepID=A4BAC6_9GAMM|nr:hypothetical protein [Reinekea blandensis]EAR10882.1 hypothetical protein MED297_10241 [Reinekea sp. MED297] [Reinekea blandensis MED297]